MTSNFNFSDLLKTLPMQWPVAVAVSGGADSMALILLLHHFAAEQDKGAQCVALTVDHRLRSESTHEAEQVHAWLSTRGIQHVILPWNHPPLTAGVEEKARDARYTLLEAYCSKENIPVLMTAHHARDQVETFWMRLARGSGLSGLCSMRPVSQKGSLTILRPLLTVWPETLKKILHDTFHQTYIQDPSNQHEVFERVRWRHSEEQLKRLGLDPIYILQSIQYLQDIEHSLLIEAQQFEKMYGMVTTQAIRLELSAFRALTPAVGKLVLRNALLKIGLAKRPCPQRLIDQTYQLIMLPHFKSATAYHCLIRRSKGGELLIQKEIRRKPIDSNMSCRMEGTRSG